MAVEFVKYHGLGNDFILIEDFGGELLPRGGRLAKTLCHRQFGIGADGLVLVVQDEDLYTMRIFNADGTEAEMCGNAIRCVADYLAKTGLVFGPVFQIGSLSGVKEISVDGELYTVDMGEADFSFSQGGAVEILSHGVTWTTYPVSMGNPHAVIFVDDLDELDFQLWGPRLEAAQEWPSGSNIEFVQVLAPDQIRVKVWERGAGPTLACGTGACASAAVSARQGLIGSLTEGSVKVSLPGGDLAIHAGEDNHIFMTGPATRVFSGRIDISQTEGVRKQ
ncbi:MAG: diaminopimelate epimerase [Bacillota bacterium]|jgi:diaminopimelate epimerase|nr:diaminopimelate epimerase [Bacillota bacterium]NLJ01945.1 diaminopimelate epimerase [Bacillota bacterium]